MNVQINQSLSEVGAALFERVIRQISFPTLSRTTIEVVMFSSVFFAAGYISLGIGVRELLAPMVPIVIVIMLANVASGVYREDITNSIMNIYIHSLYSFFLATIGVLTTISLFYPHFMDTKFIAFFLFFSFFVSNTVRPLISGTDFMDGGGRRTN